MCHDRGEPIHVSLLGSPEFTGPKVNTKHTATLKSPNRLPQLSPPDWGASMTGGPPFMCHDPGALIVAS